LVGEAYRAQQLGKMVRKHQASTFSQDPGIGANGCEPRVTARHTNWYRPVRTAENNPEEVFKRINGIAAIPGVWQVSGEGTVIPPKGFNRRLTGERRTKALFGI
jgi:hypothetical protein